MTRRKVRSARPMRAMEPLLKSRRSSSTPSLKMTPFWGMCETIVERTALGDRAVYDLGAGGLAHERLADAEDQVAACPSRTSSGRGQPGHAARSQNSCTIPAAPVRIERYHPVEPAPVETIRPLEDWSSSRSL